MGGESVVVATSGHIIIIYVFTFFFFGEGGGVAVVRGLASHQAL